MIFHYPMKNIAAVKLVWRGGVGNILVAGALAKATAPIEAQRS